jgi:hypothetical protein
MRVLGRGRRRWLAAAAVVAVAATAAVVAGSAGSTARASQAAPVVDPDYIYQQLFDMSYNDVYRVSGADGDPRNFNDPFNLKPTINGWQEFFKHWKDQLTDTSVMTTMAKYATVKDHYFHRSPDPYAVPPSSTNYYSFDPNYRWDSDDAEVTIPGLACGGERVLLAAHPDGTPVSPGIVGDVNNTLNSTSSVFGFGAARRTQTLSNLANGGAYDDTSGVTMTMGEYQALLRWYDANGTYPAKTLKIALLDADAGRKLDGTYNREGSNWYVNNLIPDGPQGQYAMFAVMDANGMSYPAYHLGTQYYWNSPTTGGVGPWRTFVTDTPSAPNQAYPDPSGAIATNSAAIAAFDADLKSAITSGFTQQSTKYGGTVTQENPLRYIAGGSNNGSAPAGLQLLPSMPNVPAYTPSDQSTYSPVHPAGTAPESEILSTEDDAAAFWQRGIPGFSVGGVQDSNIEENPYASTTAVSIRSTPILAYSGGGTSFEFGSGVPSAGMSTTTAATAVGATTVPVASGSVFTAGQPFFIDVGANLETGWITAVSGNTITLNAPLTLAHPSGARFEVNQGQPVGFTGDTLEHLNFFASGAPHGATGETAPTQELLRALELPSQYTSLLVSGSNYLGATPKPTGTVAYFESSPVHPSTGQTVQFDASFARAAEGGKAGLQYYWDFGDGTHATGETVTHTFSSAMWADVKLIVVKGDSTHWGVYRQAVKVGSPGGSPPGTPACGTLSAAERDQLVADAKAVLKVKS